VLADDKVSRRHAMIHAQGEGEFWLVDLGSSNGTYLNGRRVNQPCRLHQGDRIEIGASTFTFRMQASPVRPKGEPSTQKTIREIRSEDCWLLVADLEGSTQLLKSLPPEEASQFTGRWLATCKKIVDTHHGTINKFLGDGFLAYWPERGEAAQAVAGAVRALQALHARQSRFPFRVALHLGKVFVGGEASLGEESLMGSEVNFVFRMEKLARDLSIQWLVSDPAGARIGSKLALTSFGRQPIPDFEGAFPFFTLDRGSSKA